MESGRNPNSNTKNKIKFLAESDDESSTVESSSSIVVNEMQQKFVQPSSKQSSVEIRDSDRITIGDNIFYHGSVSIIHNHINQNQVNSVHTTEQNLSHRFETECAIDETTQDLQFVPRKEWAALEPQRTLVPLDLPAIHVIVAHTSSKRKCPTNLMDCAAYMRTMQNLHMQDPKYDWDDIGYNFAVGGDGCIYVGRGWDYRGAHSKTFNNKGICIAFMGNFWKDLPPNRSLVAAQRLIEVGVKAGKLSKNYRLYGHRQVIDTISPGNRLYEIIQTWDHWTAEVILP